MHTAKEAKFPKGFGGKWLESSILCQAVGRKTGFFRNARTQKVYLLQTYWERSFKGYIPAMRSDSKPGRGVAARGREGRVVR